MLPIQAASIRRNYSQGPLSHAIAAVAILPAGRPFTYDKDGDVCDDCYASVTQCGSKPFSACCRSGNVHDDNGQCKCR
jgi:hypothetical protein